MSEALRSAGIVIDRKETIQNYVLNAFSVFIPLLGILVGLVSSGFAAPTPMTFSLFFVFFFINIFGVSVGLHRYFSHRAFETSAGFRWLLGVWGSWAMQGPIDRWVADHRRHHRFSDQPFDLHSPYWSNQEKISSVFLRFAHAHFLWMFTERPTDKRMYAKDTTRDPIGRWCSQWYWPLCGTSLLLPALLGYAMGGTDEAVRSFFWGGCLRVALLQQFTFTVNSLGHMVGGKTKGSRDEARNLNVGLTLLLFGEGPHSYHHVHQRTAVNQPASLDLAGHLVTFLEKVRMVWNVQRH